MNGRKDINLMASADRNSSIEKYLRKNPEGPAIIVIEDALIMQRLCELGCYLNFLQEVDYQSSGFTVPSGKCVLNLFNEASSCRKK